MEKGKLKILVNILFVLLIGTFGFYLIKTVIDCISIALNKIHNVNRCWCFMVHLFSKLKSKGGNYYDNCRKDKKT